MKSRTVRSVLFSIFLVFLFVAPVSAQPVGWSVSDSQPLSELGLPFVSDRYFAANNSPGTVVLWVDGKKTDIAIPPFEFRWLYVYVASDTKIEAKANVVTDKGVKVKKLKRSRARTPDGRHHGWLFELKK